MNWRRKTDEQLADEAQTGLRGQGALVEAMRRLRVSTSQLAWVLIAFALVQTALLAFQIWQQFR